MRWPRFRFTVRGAMAVVVLVSLLLGWAAYRERIKRRLINQDIAVSSAEAVYRNAGLAREAAESAATRYARERAGEDEDSTLRALSAAARQARKKELALEAVWKVEKDRLSRLIKEFYDSRL